MADSRLEVQTLRAEYSVHKSRRQADDSAMVMDIPKARLGRASLGPTQLRVNTVAEGKPHPLLTRVGWTQSVPRYSS